MSARALDRRGERHLCLDYLLGLPVRVLVDRYGITRQTIYRILDRHQIDRDRKQT